MIYVLLDAIIPKFILTKHALSHKCLMAFLQEWSKVYWLAGCLSVFLVVLGV